LSTFNSRYEKGWFFTTKDTKKYEGCCGKIKSEVKTPDKMCEWKINKCVALLRWTKFDNFIVRRRFAKTSRRQRRQSVHDGGFYF
jgi:hypothetical protein